MRWIRFVAWGIASFVVVAITQPFPGNGQTPLSSQDSNSNIIHLDSFISKVDTSDNKKTTLNSNNLSQAGQFNLSGEWIYEMRGINFTGDCTRVTSDSGTNFQVDFNIIQNGENLIFSGEWAQYNGFSQGRISNNQLTTQSISYPNLRLKGTISSDGNKITGTLFCAKNVPFTLTRKNSQDRKSTRLNSSHVSQSRMPSSA